MIDSAAQHEILAAGVRGEAFMQLKVKRSQREAGLVGKSVIFCLDARVEFTPGEKQNIIRYKLQGTVIYNSEAQQRAAAGSAISAAQAKSHEIDILQPDRYLSTVGAKLGHGLKAAALGALAALRLTITIDSLERGQHIECKSLDELLGAEDAILTACENLRGYLETAATFDGREVVVDFSTDGPQVVAHAATPEPMLAVPPPPPPIASAPPLGLPAPADTTFHAERYTDEQAAGSGYEAARAWDQYSLQARRWWAGLQTGQQVGVVLGALILLVLLLRL